MGKPDTALDRFREEEERIRADVDEAERQYARVIEEQTKVRDRAAAGRARAQAVLAGMVADFERISEELELEEAKRLDLAGLTKGALADGRITADAYFKAGLTDAQAAASAQAVASAKLADLREVTRAQAVKVLELEAAELEAAYNVAFAQQAPAAAFRERLAALLKALETSLASPIGAGGELSAKAVRDAKLRELNNATGKRLDGDGWRDFDLPGLRRLRLDPTFPADQLPKLEEIIAEARASGRPCRLMLDPRDRKTPVNVMWG